MPEKTLYSSGRKVADQALNPNNRKATEMWIASFQEHDYGIDRRFYPDHLYFVENRRHLERIGLTFYAPREGSRGPTFLRGEFACRIFVVSNRYGQSIRAQLPVGGAKNWQAFFAQLDRAILPFKLRCE